MISSSYSSLSVGLSILRAHEAPGPPGSHIDHHDHAHEAQSVGSNPASSAGANGLLYGTKWASNTITYGFPGAAGLYEYAGEAQTNFSPATAAQRTGIERALAVYESVSQLSFELDNTAAATLRFANSDLPETAWAYLPHDAPQGGDVWFNGSSGYYANPDVGTYAYHTVLHELGHALGLKHSHESSSRFGVAPSGRQSMEYSVMSYSSYLGASTETGYTNEAVSFAQTLMMDDIGAIQSMYGANFSFNSGDNVYAWDPNSGEMSIDGAAVLTPVANRVFMTVWDGGGRDTFDFSSYTASLRVDLTPGAWSTTSNEQRATLNFMNGKKAVGSIAMAELYKGDTRSLIENAIGGSGNDTIRGNQADNVLVGGGGRDVIWGGAGNDTLIGGAGADRLEGGAGIDTADFSDATAGVSLNLTRGKGTGGDAAGDIYRSIERVIGSDHNDTITGSRIDDTLIGGAGNDSLDGGFGQDIIDGGDGDDIIRGGLGKDTLTGGAGADTFVYANLAEAGLHARNRDVITDFNVAEDVIDLSRMDANRMVAGNQAFSLLANAGEDFTAAGQVRIRYETAASGITTIIEGNVDNDMRADFQIELKGRINNFVAANFNF